MARPRTSATESVRTPSAGTLASAKRRSGETHLVPKVRERLALIPKAYQATYRRAMGGKSYLKAHCQMCVGWEDVVNGIRNCTDPACPLYAKRPYQAREATGKIGDSSDDD